jgi:hypothetical protein
MKSRFVIKVGNKKKKIKLRNIVQTVAGRSKKI